jgi:hypothetical protein
MRVPGQKFFVSASRLVAGMAGSYGCPAITSDLASVVCSLSRTASSSIKSFSDTRQNYCRF